MKLKIAITAALVAMVLVGHDLVRPLLDARPQDLSPDRYQWLPSSATDVVARSITDSFNGNGADVVSLRFTEQDLPALKSHFSSEFGSASWETSKGFDHSIEGDMRKLGFPAQHFPSNYPGTYQSMALPGHRYVLISITHRRMWYWIFYT